MTTLCFLVGSVLSSQELAPAPNTKKDDLMLGQISGRMEIISPNEISLAKFLGSGGYGEVRCLGCSPLHTLVACLPAFSSTCIAFSHDADACALLGQVYLGRWHSSEVAIKCLNPSLFFSGSDGKASKAAMADLLREADVLASLRHPNVVWVYGVVLPPLVTCCAAPCLQGSVRGLTGNHPRGWQTSSLLTAPSALAGVR
jgi:hypothetical protein